MEILETVGIKSCAVVPRQYTPYRRRKTRRQVGCPSSGLGLLSGDQISDVLADIERPDGSCDCHAVARFQVPLRVTVDATAIKLNIPDPDTAPKIATVVECQTIPSVAFRSVLGQADPRAGRTTRINALVCAYDRCMLTRFDAVALVM